VVYTYQWRHRQGDNAIQNHTVLGSLIYESHLYLISILALKIILVINYEKFTEEVQAMSECALLQQTLPEKRLAIISSKQL